jgi:hypothetical protein
VIAAERIKTRSSNWEYKCPGWLLRNGSHEGIPQYVSLDNWGLVFKKELSVERSQILRGQEAIDYIESELLSVVAVVKNDKGPGRLNQYAVKALLARLYLNAAVYRNPYGTPDFRREDMDKVIQYTAILFPDLTLYLLNILICLVIITIPIPELIFALDQRGVLETEHQRWAYWSISGDQVPRPEFPNTRGTGCGSSYL